MGMNGWRYYNHAIIQAVEIAPHKPVDITALNKREFWKTEKGYPFFAQYTTDWDCGRETGWWYIILDHPFDIERLKAKHRYQIKQGIKNFDVREIALNDYKDTLVRILNEVRIKKYGLSAVYGIASEQIEGSVYLGAFDRESGKIVGYVVLIEHSEYINLSSLKVLPEYEKRSINAAIIYAVIKRYNDYLGTIYISNGSRAINHPTTFDDYLIRLFEFRKVYCRLHIRYRWWVKIVIYILYPFRKLIARYKDKHHFLQMLNGVLMMEEISKG